jgi:DNA-binding NarL/FixJ family response regulator
MPTHSVELDTFRRRIESLRANNSRLREGLDREASLLAQFQERTGPRPSIDAETRRRLEELTARELEVLRQIAEGHSTKEIAALLGITFKTAACHRHRLMQKLEVHGTGSLVRVAISAGVVRV